MEAPGLRPLRIGEVLDVAVKIYLRNALVLFKAVAVVVVPLQVLSAVVLLSISPDTGDLVRPGFIPDPGTTGPLSAEDVRVFLVGVVLLAIVSGLGSVLATAASYKAVGDAYLGAAPSWRASLSFAIRRLGPLLWVAVLPALMLVLLGLLSVVPGIAADSAALAVLGVLVWLAVVVWLFVSWSVAVPALLAEDVRGRRALGRSFGLVRGRWWHTFAALLVGYIMNALLSALISGLFQAVLFTDVGESVVAGVVLNTLGSTIASVATTPLLAALVTVVYFDLRVRKEAFDIELLARDMGVAPSGGPSDLLPRRREAGTSPTGDEPPFWPPPPGWKPPERERGG